MEYEDIIDAMYEQRSRGFSPSHLLVTPTAINDLKNASVVGTTSIEIQSNTRDRVANVAGLNVFREENLSGTGIDGVLIAKNGTATTITT